MGAVVNGKESAEHAGPRPSAWGRIKPWLRGEPLHVPSHALVVHFPAALLPVSVACDLGALAWPGIGLARAATIMLALGLAGALAAAGTGLIDWLDMIPGTARRARVTRHLLVQVSAVGLFVVDLAFRLGVGDAPTAPPIAIVVGVIGTGVLIVGNHLGGLLVYRDAMRVRTGRG